MIETPFLFAYWQYSELCTKHTRVITIPANTVVKLVLYCKFRKNSVELFKGRINKLMDDH